MAEELHLCLTSFHLLLIHSHHMHDQYLPANKNQLIPPIHTSATAPNKITIHISRLPPGEDNRQVLTANLLNFPHYLCLVLKTHHISQILLNTKTHLDLVVLLKEGQLLT